MSRIKSHPIERFVAKNPALAFLITIGIMVGIGFTGWGVYRLVTAQQAPKVAVVSFGDGQNSITVERDGTVTVVTPTGTYKQKWDKEKIRRFFESVDTLDFDQLSEYVGSGLAITLTMASGDKIQVIIDEKTEKIVDVIQAALEEVYANELAPLPTIKPLLSPSPTPIVQATSLPQPTTTPASTIDSYNPWQTGGDIKDVKVFGCQQFDPKTGRKIIISNTVCAQ